jgi:hypothetical protein
VRSQQKSKIFIKNNEAVLGLPMRLTVSLVIGTVALVAILSFIMNPCLFPQKMIVSVTPMVVTFSGNNSENITFHVNISERSGYPLYGASVIIKGLGGAGSGFSNESGMALVQLWVQMEIGIHEGYLSVFVTAPCHESIQCQELIKIVRSDA